MIKIFLLIAVILVFLILLIKPKQYIFLNSKNDRNLKTTNIDNSLKVKSAVFDNKSNLHLITNHGPKIIRNTNSKKENKFRMEINTLIQENAEILGYYAKTNQVFYVFEKNSVKFINDSRDKTYSLDELYNINHSNNKINSIVPYENYTLIAFSDIIYKYCHSVESVVGKFEGISDFNYDFILNDPLYDKIHYINSNTSIYKTHLETRENLLHKDYSNFFRNKVHIHNFGINGLSGPTDLNIPESENITIDDNGFQTFTVPQTREYTIELLGAGLNNSGKGGKIVKNMNLIKGDKLKFLIGNSGFRMPCCENDFERENGVLPLLNSCSGSGASAMTLNGKLELVAGGGGGWSSQYSYPPNICNSVNASESIKSKFIISVKSIKFKKSVFFESVESFNFTIPKINTSNGKYYIFKEELTDFKIVLKKHTKLPLSLVINEKYTISEYDSLEITPCKLFKKIYNDKLFTSLNSSDYQENIGAKEGFDIMKSNDPLSLKKNSYSPKNEKHNVLYGGFGGGGFASKRLNSYLCNSGGGGGYLGGNCCVSDFNDNIDGTINKILNLDSREQILFNNKKVPIPETAGSGGTSFINSKLELPKRYYNYNDINGYANIYFSNSSRQEVNSDINQNIQEFDCLKEREKNEFNGELKSDSNGVIKIKLQKYDTQNINLEILLYPDINQLKYKQEIDISCHSLKDNQSGKEWNEMFSYYQNGYPYTSNEIIPEKIEIGTNNTIRFLNNFTSDNTKKNAKYFLSSDTIKHTQSFNLVKNTDNIYIVMKFTGKYKITILKNNLKD